MQKFEPKIPELLNHLHRHRVDFIVVGGVCAVLHGAPVTTFDLDVVQAGKLGTTEAELSAFYTKWTEK